MFPLKTGKSSPPCAWLSTEEAAQRGCGVSILGGCQNLPGLGQPAPIWQLGAGAGNCWEALPTRIFLASFEEEEEEQEASTASTQEGFCVASFFFSEGFCVVDRLWLPLFTNTDGSSEATLVCMEVQSALIWVALLAGSQAGGQHHSSPVGTRAGNAPCPCWR